MQVHTEAASAHWLRKDFAVIAHPDGRSGLAPNQVFSLDCASSPKNKWEDPLNFIEKISRWIFFLKIINIQASADIGNLLKFLEMGVISV